MRNAVLWMTASSFVGFCLAAAFVEPVDAWLVARYPGVSVNALGSLGDPARLAWLVAAAFCAATAAALLAPRLLTTESLGAGAVRALAFTGSLAVSLVLPAVVFVCATSQPTSPPVVEAQQALVHAGQCLRVGEVFAQLLVAVAFLVLRGHIARDLPPSAFSIHGYAALPAKTDSAAR